MESVELRLGRSGQHLAMFDLLSRGYMCCQTDEGMPYDIIVDLGIRLVRLQVKTTSRPARMNSQYHSPTYLFHVRRSGRGGKREYSVGEFEGFALVCADTRLVWYYPFLETLKKTLMFRVPGVEYKQKFGRAAPRMDEFTADRFFPAFAQASVDIAMLDAATRCRENQISDEMRLVLEQLKRGNCKSAGDIASATNVSRRRVNQILSRRATYAGGQWNLLELKPNGRKAKWDG